MITSLQRTLIISELTNKAKNWSKNNPMAKHSWPRTVGERIEDFYIDRDDNGYYYVSSNLVSYCDLRKGYVFRIRRRYTKWDWNCYVELSQKSIEMNSFRMDIPLHREEITIDLEKWEYGELQSPGSDYGQNFNDDVFEWPELIDGITVNPSIDQTLKTQVSEYYKEFVDQALIIMKQARDISLKYNCGMPYDLCHLFSRFKDQSGYFWSDFDQQSWVNSRDEVVRESLIMFEMSLGFGLMCGVLDQSQVGEIFEYASEKWQTI